MEGQRGKFNNHHLWWEKRDYSRGLKRAFRNFPGNVVPTLVVQHNQLHHDMLPPLMPSRRQMMEAMDLLDGQQQTDNVYGALILKAYFLDEAFSLPSCEQSERALAIHEHLDQQIGYLTLRGTYDYTTIRG